MGQYEQLLQALADSRGAYDDAYANLQPLQQKMHDASTLRFRGLIPALIETAYDAHKRKKVGPEYQSALQEAMASARGVDDRQRELDQFIAQQEAMNEWLKLQEQRAYEEKQGATKFDRDKELQAQKDAAAKERAGMRNQPNLTYNIPAGYMPVDPSNPLSGVQPIPGSKQDMERQEQEAARAQQESAKTLKADRTDDLVNVIDTAIANVDNVTAGWGGLMANVPASRAKTLEGDIKTVQASLAFDRLQQMRDESKTGGALGQVSNIELDLLKSSVAALDQTTDPKVLKHRLGRVRKHYTNFISALKGKMPEGYDEGGNLVGGGDLEAMARKAIEAGADPEAVRKRLEELIRGR